MHGNNDGLADSSSKTKGTDRGKGIKDKPNGSFRGNHVFSSTSSLQPVGTIDRYARYQGIHHPTVSCCYGMLCRICSAVFQPKNRYSCVDHAHLQLLPGNMNSGTTVVRIRGIPALKYVDCEEDFDRRSV